MRLRCELKMIAETHGSDVYRHYMSIEEAIQMLDQKPKA